ncbi:peptide ABC transporter substrate-binding protein [Lentilactobacillus sp. Marseille-Q4993]|uniref:peptide ABC transporter substrate-binding protein n=1 Tax=Lentilactobacillus sp. Marseille-Q4993 TaxID=3039492 RepID=UPI0024BCD268|nr:peptide ABC transporter substrate-binding protein [Lentilactobacillus sp. Marseille-Q4993]
MKLSSVAKLAGVAFASALVLAGCGSNSSSKPAKKSITWMQISSLTTMDLSKVTDLIAAQTINNTNEGLLRMSTNSKVVPGVAKNYTISKDGKTWTFNLRKSKWSDGSAVTAKDFVYSWRRTLAPKTASQYAYIFDHIKNANAVNAGKMPTSKLGVKAEGKYKLVVTLNRPQSYFKFLVAQAYFAPQKESYVKKYGSKYGTTAKALAYNGPYILKGWNGTNDTWQIVKNKNYWDKKRVKLDEVKFTTIKDPSTGLNQYQSGKLDVATLSGQQVKNYKNNKEFASRKIAATWYLEMNQKKIPFFKNKNIRKAISLAIDRKELTNDVLADGSIPAKGFVASNMAYHNGKDFADEAAVKDAVSSNLTEAKKYWAKGLKETGKKNVTFTLNADDTDSGKKTAEYIQSCLNKLPGMKIQNQNLPYKTRLARSASRDFDMVLSGWTGDFPDPITFLTLMSTGNAYNDGQWSNKQYDTLVKNAEGKDANNVDKRWDDMVKAEKLLVNEEGVVPLYQQVTPQLVKSKVKNIKFYPTAPVWDWSYVSLSK